VRSPTFLPPLCGSPTGHWYFESILRKKMTNPMKKPEELATKPPSMLLTILPTSLLEAGS
jgi:hypothetical protein